MAPKTIAFEKDVVLAAAVEVVRCDGLAGLTARAVAGRLRSSVGPVYRAFRSMDGLTRGALEAARRRLDERTRRAYTDIPFLNIGVGMVAFARDESRLFAALFLSRHHCLDILKSFRDSVLARMKEDPMLRLLPDSSLQTLLDSLWLYTLGLASAVVYGQIPDTGDAAVIKRLKDMGNILIHAEVAGISDCESPESERIWTRLLKEKGIALPEKRGASCADQGRKEKK
jgi:AcrR family transcriptional regulator